MAQNHLAGLSIRWKLPLLVVGVSLVVAGAILWTAHREVRRSAIALTEERLVDATASLSDRLGTQLRSAERRLHDLAADSAIQRYFLTQTREDHDAMRASLGTIREGTGQTLWIDAVSPDGAVLAPENDPPSPVGGLDALDLAAWSSGPDGAGAGTIRVHNDSLVYPLVTRVGDIGEFAGYLVVWQYLGPSALGSALIADLVGAEARFFIGTPGGAWGDQDGVADSPGVALTDTTSFERFEDPVGDPWLAASRRIPATPWAVVVATPERGVLAPVRRFLLNVGVASLLIVAAGAGLGILMSRRISRPIGALTLAAEAVGEGGHRVRVPVMSNDEVGRLALTFNRMSERLDEEAVARALAEEQWRLLFVENPHPMWVFDQESLAFLAVNQAAVANYGYSAEEFLTMSIEQIRPAEELPRLQESLAKPPTVSAPAHFRHRRKDGRELDVEIRTQAITFNRRPARLVLAQDISARVALEAVVRQSQKMEAVGRLAGGVAHDFNNYLAVIMTYTELAREGLGEGEPRAADLAEIAKAAERAHALTRQLLAFSRQQVVQPAVFKPVDVVRATKQVLQRLLGEQVTVTVTVEDETGHVLLDQGQFEQVVLNLALNARDAMPNGGALSLTVSVTDLDEASAQLHGVPAEGRFVVLSVADNGMGMTPGVRSRIFEPFFTTKDAGKGTGLGLATAYGIIQQAGGNITVYSEPGAGAVFRIYLPEVEAHSGAMAAPTRTATLPRGDETILIVEDDAAVRAAATAALERLGYTVLTAQGAAEARMIMARRGDSVDLVISDVVMPETDGPTLIRELRASHAPTQAILMSGYTGASVTVQQGKADGVTFLEKPFTVGVLAGTVRGVLDGQKMTIDERVAP
ncbi:MAG TPA: ATP-binding protein [Gemmatimonadales bacterium]|nr:ATP-binding protein [Gemmatimonadales bacterium]